LKRKSPSLPEDRDNSGSQKRNYDRSHQDVHDLADGEQVRAADEIHDLAARAEQDPLNQAIHEYRDSAYEQTVRDRARSITVVSDPGPARSGVVIGMTAKESGSRVLVVAVLVSVTPSGSADRASRSANSRRSAPPAISKSTMLIPRNERISTPRKAKIRRSPAATETARLEINQTSSGEPRVIDTKNGRTPIGSSMTKRVIIPLVSSELITKTKGSAVMKPRHAESS
jgi:hypothetical protein